jgi:hypothetical protein
MRALRTIVMSRFAIFQMQRRDAPRFEIDWYIYHRARRKILDVRRIEYLNYVYIPQAPRRVSPCEQAERASSGLAYAAAAPDAFRAAAWPTPREPGPNRPWVAPEFWPAGTQRPSRPRNVRLGTCDGPALADPFCVAERTRRRIEGCSIPKTAAPAFDIGAGTGTSAGSRGRRQALPIRYGYGY